VPGLETAFAYEAIFQRTTSELFGGIYERIEDEVAVRVKLLVHQIETVSLGESRSRLRSHHFRHKLKAEDEIILRQNVKQAFFPDGDGTKHGIAEIVAKRFPEELGFRLPPKRRAWESEDSRMAIFDAVALVLMLRLQKKRIVDHSSAISKVSDL
jgi:hypothetical protein